MIAACIRYCTVSSRATSGRSRPTSRSIRLTDKPALGRLRRDDRRRQLAVVAGEDELVRPQQRHPARRLGGLARLVDHREVEPPLAEQLAVEAGERGADDAGLVQHPLDGEGFELAGFARAVSRASRRSAAFSPGLRLARVHLSAWRNRANASRATLRACRASGCFSARMSMARARSSGTTRAGWPEPHRQFAGREQLFEQVIDRVVARAQASTRVAARDRLPDELDHGRGLSRCPAGRG